MVTLRTEVSQSLARPCSEVSDAELESIIPESAHTASHEGDGGRQLTWLDRHDSMTATSRMSCIFVGNLIVATCSKEDFEREIRSG